MRSESIFGAWCATLLLIAGCTGADTTPRGNDAAAGRDSAPPSEAGAGLLAYVTNEDSQELTIIDTRTDSAVATIPVGTRPRGVRVSRDGKTVFVALSGSPKCPPTMPDEECEKLKSDKSKDGIAVVDAASRTVTRVLPGGSDPETFDISRDGTTLFVSNEDAGTASIVDIASGKIRSTVEVGKEPEGVRVHPDGKTAWVTGETDHNVTLVDTRTGKTVAQVEVGKRPRSLAFTPDGARAYVTSEVDGTVWVIDVAGRKKLKVITMPDGAKPMDAEASPDGSRIYVSNGRGGTVSVIDVASDSVVGNVKVGQRPWGIALTPDGTKLYSANGPSNDVSVVDAQRLTVLRTVPVGKIPWGVAIGQAP
ncbi:MAG TPA: beta-propeller fold lactonase family protein [Gemmatimonadales bacterium]|nr:beta-propeller fold lactonase family protein [Gemmatimonadales bacterium]